MNVQMKTKQELMDQMKVWYEEVYPNMIEDMEEECSTYFVNGRRMNEQQFLQLKQDAYAKNEIIIEHKSQISVKQGYQLDSCQLMMQDKQTGSAMKKQVNRWTHMKESDTNGSEVWLFVF